MKTILRRFPWLVLLLAGCTVTPPGVTPTAVETVDQAMIALHEGRYDEAISRFTALRDKAVQPKRQEYELYIAEALHKSERSQQAEQVLEAMRLAGLPPQLLMRRQLLRGEIMLPKDPELALSILQSPAAPATELAMHANFYRLRALVYGRLGKPVETAREHVAYERFLDNDAAREANHLAIWQALGTLPRESLEKVRRLPPPDTLSDWLELAAILEVAVEYTRLGLFADAEALLARDWPSGPAVVTEPGMPHPSAYPLMAYFRGYCRARLGRDGRADYDAASRMSTLYVFPNRPETAAVLRAALEANPRDATAHALLGSLYLSGGLVDEAMREWEVARAINPSIPALHRNMAHHADGDRRIARTRHRAVSRGHAPRFAKRTRRAERRRWRRFHARSRT